MISIWAVIPGLLVAGGLFYVMTWALQSRIKELEKDLLEARGMRDYWEGVAESRKED